MKLLVFEYSSITQQSNLISEGFGMLEAILEDLEDIEDFDVTYLLNKNLKIRNIKNCNRITIESDIYTWLESNSKEYDYCLFIAPEDDLIQYNITRILEENNVSIIGSDSNASFICSSKFRTYKSLPESIKKIPTRLVRIDDIDYGKIKKLLSKKKLVVKPVDKTSSDFIYKIDSISEFKEFLEIYEKNDIKEFLLQDYVSGVSVSTSNITSKNNTEIISLNLQEIRIEDNNITYTGCKTPFNHHMKKEIESISKKIISEIDGLCGFIGIDYIISEDEIYFVEVNARITTPFIVLRKLSNKNLTKIIIDSVIKNNVSDFTISGCGNFRK